MDRKNKGIGNGIIKQLSGGKRTCRVFQCVGKDYIQRCWWSCSTIQGVDGGISILDNCTMNKTMFYIFMPAGMGAVWFTLLVKFVTKLPWNWFIYIKMSCLTI